MANIFVKIDDIKGEVPDGTYKDQIQCVAMRHVQILPVDLSATRTLGKSKQGAIALTHAIDKASPLLKKACMTNSNNQGTVKITRTQTGGVAESIQITNAAIVRVDVETPLSATTQQPGDDLLETFYLDYSSGEIQWDYGNVAGNYNPTQTDESG